MAAACGTSAPPQGITLDPCTPATIAAPAATADQLASIDAAIAAWNTHGIAQLVRIPDGADLQLALVSGNPAVYGEYDPATATIFCNVELADPERTIVIAHELGHAFGLTHVAADVRVSVMNPGNLVELPDAGDADALAARWGQCGTPDAP